MNTRVFKDITRIQHKAWGGFTTRQAVFVLPAIVVTAAVLILNVIYLHLGSWFEYSIIFGFTLPLLLFGVYRPNHLNFEVYVKYRWNWEMRVPVRTLVQTEREETHVSIRKKKNPKIIRETDWESVKG